MHRERLASGLEVSLLTLLVKWTSLIFEDKKVRLLTD